MRAHRDSLALAGVLVLAAALRFTSIGFDLDLREPNGTLLANHVDALAMVRQVERALATGSLDPGSFLYRGPGGFLVFAVADALAVALASVRHPEGRAGVLADLAVNPAPLALIHRCISALAGVLTVLVIVRLTRREFGARAGLAAGLILAVCYLHVRESHLGTVDVLWGLALVLALDAIFRLVVDPRPSSYARAGLLTGAAVAMKYFSAALGLHLLVAHALARRRARADGRPEPGLARLVAMLALVPAGFVLFFPGLFAGAARSLVERVELGADRVAPQWDGVSQFWILAYHVTQTIGIGLGELALVAAAAGLVIAWRRRGDQGRFLALSVLMLVPMLLLTGTGVVRYGLGFLVVLPIPAGIAVAAAFETRRALGAVVLAGVLAPSLARSVALDLLWSEPDTRVLALAELDRRCASGDRVVAVGFKYDRLDPGGPQRFRLVNLAESSHRRTLSPEDVLADPPRWLLFGPEATVELVPGGPELRELARTRYRPVVVLGDPLAAPLGGEPGTVQATLQIPYARPWTCERPGPGMTLYERVD